MEFNFEGKTGEELEARKLELRDKAMTVDKSELNPIEEEVRAINAELETRKAAVEKRKKEIKEVLEIRSEPIEKNPKEEKRMNEKDIRSSKEYIDAYVRYIKEKDNDGAECRALLSVNATGEDVTGQVPVPTYVEGRIQTAWENDEILKRISKTYFPGNYQVGVEMAADPAVVHDEGADAPDEENLTIAIVDIVAKSVKKWITVSDEVLDLKGEEFLDYLYDEIEYQIVKKAAEVALDTVLDAPATGTEAPTVSRLGVTELALDDIINAIGNLSGDARDIVFIANRATIAAYQGLALAANYSIDIFAGATVIPIDILPAFRQGVTGPFALVGDLSAIRGNFPRRDDVKFTFDPYTFSEKDLVKIVGRLYAGFGLVKDKAFSVLAAGTIGNGNLPINPGN